MSGRKRKLFRIFWGSFFTFSALFLQENFLVLQIHFCTFPFDTFLRASFYNIQHSRMKSLYFCVIRKTNFRNVRSEVFQYFPWKIILVIFKDNAMRARMDQVWCAMMFVFTQDRKLPVVCLMCNPLYLTLLISISKSKAISAPKRAFAMLWAFWCKGLSSRGLPRYRLGHMIWVMFSTLPALLELEDTGGWVAWLPKSWRWFEASNFPLMKSSYNIPYHFSSSWLKTLGTTKKPEKITFHNSHLNFPSYLVVH